MEDFSLLVESWKNIQKAKRIHNLCLLLQQKGLGEVKNVQLSDFLIHSTTVKVQLLPYIFLSFPHCPQRLIAGVTWYRGKVTRIGLVFPRILFYVTTILPKKILKSHFWDGSCYQVLFPHKTCQVKPLHQNKNKNYQ